jgi:hypothetical protein
VVAASSPGAAAKPRFTAGIYFAWIPALLGQDLISVLDFCSKVAGQISYFHFRCSSVCRFVFQAQGFLVLQVFLW